MLTVCLWHKLIDVNLEDTWFQKNSVTPNFAKETIVLLKQTFPGRIISITGEVIDYPGYAI